MKNKVVRLTESDLEKLVQRIIKENDMETAPEMGKKSVSTGSLRKDIKDTSKNLGAMAGLEKEATNKLNSVIQKLNEPGNQLTPNAKNLLARLFKEFGM